MKKFLLTLALSLAAGIVAAADRPYDESADAKAQIALALRDAAAAHEPVLLIFGANWCEDCRALDHALKSSRNAQLMGRFKVVKVDVGHFDHNVDVSTAYGNATVKGIPSAVIVSPQNQILFMTKAGELADARRMSEDGVYQFFTKAEAATHQQ
ncbi:MAG TPA: thioredoxin family protein [Burkholderiaceae bacterium]